MKIKEILKLDLNEDIKNVIDLEDKSESEIQSEIESYIITDGLGRHLDDFITQYTSNIKETGVWLSGFYGSGKSYFGKMIGYLLANPLINGTTARDRFILRLKGIKNADFLENSIRNLDSVDSKVIFLDVAKQNTDKGLAFTLFANFLKDLGFRDDVYGYIEYDLYVDDKYDFLQTKAKELFGKDWVEIKKNNREIAKAMRRVFGAMDYSDAEFNDTKATYSEAISGFSSAKLKDELEKYANKFPDKRVVFIFDEASEAISQKKFTLLDLEAISESLSSMSKKVWSIAIAQEKLNDVINNANVTKSDLTKVTDRFKTKIHLESTDVDVIIQNRLLLKKDDVYQKLLSYYKEKEGQISDATNLKSSFPTKTESADEFATYYPFHKYQFDILQKFLFSSNALVASQIAARGMIITTFDVLRNALKERELFDFTTSQDLCVEAQTSPPAELVNKYDNAKKIIEKAELKIQGDLLLKAIHFLNESELISTNIENITKTYITNISSYYKYKPEIEKALELLLDAKILLLSNNNFTITSDLETKLLEEMKDFSVELGEKKRALFNYLKSFGLFRQIATINENTSSYNFNILTDVDDEIIASNNKNLKFTVFNLFNISGDKQDFVEKIKLDTQYNKNLITLIPDNNQFGKIDKLLESIKRYSYMEDKYANDSDDKKKQIINTFSTIKNENEKDLVRLIEESYSNSSVIYMFNESLVNDDNFKININQIQNKLIKNIYTKRLKTQLSESVGFKLIREKNIANLSNYFTNDDFKFFDKNGNFVGENLKVIEEITQKTNKYIDGKSLEEELLIAPWGYTYGTISTVLAVLLKAGRLIIKHNSTDYHSAKDEGVIDIFNSGKKFKEARFKTTSKQLSSRTKKEIVDILLDLDFKKHAEEVINWEASDFELANAISKLADVFITKIRTIENTQPDFKKLFSDVVSQKDTLRNYSVKTTEDNYIDKCENLIKTKDDYKTAIKSIVKAEKFIKKNLVKIKRFEAFVADIKVELSKAYITNDVIINATKDIDTQIKNSVIDNFPVIQELAQNIKDEYYSLMLNSVKIMTDKYSLLIPNIKSAHAKLLKNYPPELNAENRNKLAQLLRYSENKVVKEIDIKFAVKCAITNFSISDIKNYIELYPNKETELDMIIGNFVKKQPKPSDSVKPKQAKKISLSISKKTMTASEYRSILSGQLKAMAGMDNDEKIELTIKQ